MKPKARRRRSQIMVHALLARDFEFIGRQVYPNLMRWRLKEPCIWCGRFPRELEVPRKLHTREHLVPYALGGRGGHENTMPACPRDNHSRACHTLLRFLIKRGGYGL